MSRCRGLTLIEVLAGLALAGLLAAALFQSLGVVVRSERRLAQESPAEEVTPWRAAIYTQIRADLDQALSVELDDQEVRLEGWCGRDVERGTSSHDAVAVTYRLDRDSNVLYREQVSLGEARQQPTQRELVAAGAAGWGGDGSGRLVLRFADPSTEPLRFSLADRRVLRGDR